MKRKGASLYLNLFVFVAVCLFGTVLVFDDEIAGWFAENREDLTPLLTIETQKSKWDLRVCINDLKVSGLGLQNRKGPREFMWTDTTGVARRVDSYANAARNTRLDVIDHGEYNLVQFFGPDGHKMRKGERQHLAECLGLKKLPTN